MERAKEERRVARRRFTTCANKLDELFVKNIKDRNIIQVEFNKLSSIYSELQIVQNKVLNLWLDLEDRDEKLFDQDVDTADEYIDRWFSLEQKVKNWFESNGSESHSAHTYIEKEACGSSSSHARYRHYRLPKLELPTFNGEIKGWLAFWTQFKKIHSDESIDNDDKFQYLRQCMEPGSIAKELIDSFPPSGDNYSKAMEQLRQRFARDELIIEHYVRELLYLVLAQAKGTNSKTSIRSLYDKIITQILALESLGVTQDKYAAFLFPLIESALPEDLLRAWHRNSFQSSVNVNPLSKLLEFVKQEVESEERIRLARSGFSSDLTDPAVPSTSCFATADKTSSIKGNQKQSSNFNSCLFCEKTTHNSSECVLAVNKTLEERRDIVKQKGACGICLCTGHYWKKCKKHPKCVFCGKRHFPIMCNSMKQTPNENMDKKGEQVAITQSCTHNDKVVLLQTLKIKVKSSYGELTIRALLDSGAQRSFIKTDVAEKLKLKPICSQELSHCLFGGSEIKKQLHNLYNVNIINLNNSFSFNLDVLGQNVICGNLPQLRPGELMCRLNELGISVTDCTDDISEISMLIGSNVLGSLYTGRAVRVDENLLAVETKLGWTVQGPAVGVYCSVDYINTLHCTFNIDDFWKLETLGIRDDAEKKSQKMLDDEIMKFFESTITVNLDNRYEVRLPWKETSKTLRSNYGTALKRLHSTTARLTKLGILNDYDNLFQEWVEEGVIEAVKCDEPDSGHYLPHHAVVKESSLTTKIRPVFDASSKDLNGLSINSCLEKGINLIEIIPKLLLNFRRNAIGVTADIKRAFLQISVHPDDRNYLKFLWWHDVNSNNKIIKTYRHKRVVFGVTTSPFLLSATILYHLKKFKNRTSELLEKSFYVDNCVLSVKNRKELNDFVSKAKAIMLRGQFELRCWVTGPIITDEDAQITSVLGLMWDPHRDELFCKIPTVYKYLQGDGFTKRKVLSIAQSIFDPLGLFSPVTVLPKLVIQKCWILNIEWDRKLPQDLNKIMLDWVHQIQLLEACRVQRRICQADIDQCENTFHVFCDASQYAYACCIFLRSVYNNIVNVQLVIAKSRVAPTKCITMPRLELIAALMGTRFMSEVKSSLDVQGKEFYWSDSSIVLAWLRRKEGLNVFVHNRVSEILQRTNIDDWQHVPGEVNPADLPSRGCSGKKLLESNWWAGPAWLYRSKQDWPMCSAKPDEVEVLKEVKKSCLTAFTNNLEKFSERFTYFSKYSKIVRMLAWCLRFINNCRSKKSRISGDIFAQEYIKAESVLLLIIQQEDNLENISNFQIFKDNGGLIRLKTRLTLSDNLEDFKTPILLSARNTIIERLVFQKHAELLHAGSQTLISNLRESYWIIGVRRLAKKIVSKCVTCRRFSAKACTAPSAPLPLNRVSCGSVFEVTGVDLAGPLLLKSKQKCWIILFTCATYRAIHLELITSLSTEDFMLGLRRFLARRGRVSVIYSDNGTNLRGASNVMNNADWQRIAEKVSIQKIKWRFLPPSAPWWGGFYERMVRTLKEILRRVLGKSALQENELQTVLCETEAVINSRPLTYIADNTDNLRPLTPDMFLHIDGARNELDYMDHIGGNILTSRWRYLNNINAQLKTRFRSEYLSQLVEFVSNKTRRDLQIGDIVLVGSDNKKRVHWPLALVLDIYPGVDGHGRVALIKTSSGERVRALQRLFRLEVSCSDELVTNKNNSINTNPVNNTAKVTRAGRTVKVPERLGF